LRALEEVPTIGLLENNDGIAFMTRTARNRLVAWLGIAAMWLAIVAPLVSQSIAARAAADDPQAALCRADLLAGIASIAQAGDGHGVHQSSSPTAQAQAGATGQDAHHGPGHLDACSYCGLLAHHLAVVSGAAPGAVRIERITRAQAPATPLAAFTKSFNAARPRAPPAVS
jgi:hypothetical protein